MLNVIKKLLANIIDDIDSGNSNITEEEGMKVIELLRDVSSPRLSKY